MARRALASVLLLVALVPAVAEGATRRAARTEDRKAARAVDARARARPSRQPARRQSHPSFAEAKAAMTALMRDRSRRRYRHHWERAIGGLLRSARGKDAPAALLEAARARYALYRWSANEADREAALDLAKRAGSRDGAALARAIRREAGEERAAAPPRAKRTHQPRPERSIDEDSPPDPALEAAVADLAPNAPPAMPLGRSDGGGSARVTGVRSWASDDYTRVAVYLSRWVGWQKLELPSGPDLPRRLAIDFRPAALAGAALARPIAGGQVDRVRAAQHDPETVRVVLDLPGADVVQVFALDDPPRLVLDVGSLKERRGAAVARAEPPSAAAAEGEAAAEPADARPDDARVETEEEKAPVAIRRIVVDAGHGGHDPGAIGPRRIREKDVTLAMARRLARKLREAGFEVVLTRDNDRFLALEERTAIANTARGDLFVSIHANAHPHRNRSGVETYFLNTADDRYAARLAARENGLDLGEGEPEVARILTDLGAKASAGSSRQLAGLVQREVTRGVRARIGEVRDLGVKSALFYVLLGARMPAVLVEAAFISNRDEERRLASATYQDEVAGGIARAVSAFARAQHRVAAAR